MSDTSQVTLLYTANLKGHLALLPRLFTLIQQERRRALGVVFLLDLGDTCSLESWVCRATHGRAPLFVLDSMGYDAALIGGPEEVSIPVPSLRRLLDRIVMPVLIWDRAIALTKRGVTIHLASGRAAVPDTLPVIWIDRSAPALPETTRPRLRLGDVPPAHVARVDLVWPDWTLQSTGLLPLPPDTPPDPTIGAVVELVESEARVYLEQQGGEP